MCGCKPPIQQKFGYVKAVSTPQFYSVHEQTDAWSVSYYQSLKTASGILLLLLPVSIGRGRS